MKKECIARTASAIAFSAALLPLAFSFGEHQIQFLLSSPYHWIIWIGLGVTAVLLLALGKMWSGAELAALCILYAMVPFAFYFSNGGAQFIISGANGWLATACWAVSLLSFIQYKSVKVLRQ